MPESRLARARIAGTAFVRGTTAGWSRRDLAEWLVCQYAPCVGPNGRREAHDASRSGAAALAAGPATVMPVALDEGALEDIVLEARRRTLRLLADLVVPWEASPIARLAVASGIVASERDPRGGVAYAPVALPRMRLADRVASLFIADWLNGPSDYRWLMHCRACGELAFSTELEHAPACDADADQWLAFTPADAILTAAGA